MADNIKNEKKRIFDRVISVVKSMLQVSQDQGMRKLPEITLKTDIFNDLGVDSVEVMDLMGMLEKEFNISIDLEKVAGKRTIGEISNYIDNLLQEV